MPDRRQVLNIVILYILMYIINIIASLVLGSISPNKKEYAFLHKEKNMRKTAVFLIIIMLAVLMLAGCQKEADAPSAATGEQAAETPLPETEATQTAPPKYTPADILGEELNPLYGVEFPEDFSLESVFIHTPGWGITGDAAQYQMSFTAPKDNETIIAMAGIMGVTAEDEINGYIDAFKKNGSIMIGGGETEGGADCVCEIKTTEKDNGWEVQLAANIGREEEEKYIKFIEDSYNMNVFGTVAKSMALLPVPDDFKINVCYVDVDDMMKTEFEAIYTLDDRPAVMDSLLTGGGYDWYDSQNKKIGIDYGDMHGDIWFSDNNNQINIHQECKGVPATPLSEYINKPAVTLELYGFNFNPEQGVSLYENRSGEYSKLGFHSPEWGDMEGDAWGFEFLYPLEGGLAVVWFRPEENRYDIRLEAGDGFVQYAYDIEKNTYGSMYPNKETVDQYLNDLFGSQGIEDKYGQVFRILEQYSLDISGKDFEALAALPPTAGGGYAPMTVLPVLPESGGTRTTLATMGFEYEAENGYWIYRDRDGGNLIDINLNRDMIQYFQTVNGHSFVISYYPDKGRYEAQAYEEEEPTEDSVQSYFAYDIKNNTVLDRDTQGIDMKPEEFFPKMLGIPQTDTVFLDVISIFQQYTMDRFSMTPDELYRMDIE